MTLLYNKLIIYTFYYGVVQILKTERKKINVKAHLKAIIAVSVCAALIIGVVVADFVKGRKEYSANDIAMNTIISIKLYGSDGKENAETVKSELHDIEKSLLSRYEEGSDVYRINNASDGEAVAVSPEVASIISDAVDISADCGGVFDITVGRITELWGFGGDSPRLPSSNGINALLPYVGSQKLKLSDSTVKLGSNQAIDLGAVGKGAACDMIKTRLSSMSSDSALISVGGSLLLYGKRDFTIGISNPENDKEYMGTLKLSDTCVSTSGDYEQFFEQDGKTYHHILNALTGYPADSHLKSVTVICESGVCSDALSTACFIMGYNDNSLALLKKYNAEAVFITSNKIVRCTDGIKDSFELSDKSFIMGE